MQPNEFKIARLLQGKKQSEIAAMTGIPASQLSMFENNRFILRDEQVLALENVLPLLSKVRILLER